MAKKKVKKKAVKKQTTKKKATKKKTTKKKTAKRQKPAKKKPAAIPSSRKTIKPFEVCNYFGVYLREIFEKEHSRDRHVQLGQVFECLLSDLNGAWNLVKLYGRETPLARLHGEANPFHYDR